jgi:hypothetical protein
MLSLAFVVRLVAPFWSIVHRPSGVFRWIIGRSLVVSTRLRNRDLTSPLTCDCERSFAFAFTFFHRRTGFFKSQYLGPSDSRDARLGHSQILFFELRDES